MSGGIVYLVGAGPGDPGLLTVKGSECLKKAGVVLYDGLSNPKMMDAVPEDCEKISVEKRPGFQSRKQVEINALMVEKARAGMTVVRLKGGDPFIFGRGGDEAEFLGKEGIRFEVIPGVTSAVAAPAYAGIPVTHRGTSTHVTFVTGHTASLSGEVDWEALAKVGGTIVVYMGVGNRGAYARLLMEAGLPGSTPVAVIQRGTMPNQLTIRTSLDRLEHADVESPAAIVIGDVAAMNYEWFESQPLFGRKIVVTRSRSQAGSLVQALRDLGAMAIEIPTIQLNPPGEWGPVDEAILNVSIFDWLVFTSANGVAYFLDRLFELGKDSRVLGGLRLAAVGPGTSEKLSQYGLRADLCPDWHIAEGLLESFRDLENLSSSHFLISRPELSREALAEGLRELGAKATEVIAYRTVKPESIPNEVLPLLEDGCDMITFTSSSTVRHFVELIGDNRIKNLAEVPVACIGPKTAETARSMGFKVVAQPDDDAISIDGLADSILAHYKDAMKV